jgi:hypothetical protein
MTKAMTLMRINRPGSLASQKAANVTKRHGLQPRRQEHRKTQHNQSKGRDAAQQAQAVLYSALLTIRPSGARRTQKPEWADQHSTKKTAQHP